MITGNVDLDLLLTVPAAQVPLSPVGRGALAAACVRETAIVGTVAVAGIAPVPVLGRSEQTGIVVHVPVRLGLRLGRHRHGDRCKDRREHDGGERSCDGLEPHGSLQLVGRRGSETPFGRHLAARCAATSTSVASTPGSGGGVHARRTGSQPCDEPDRRRRRDDRPRGGRGAVGLRDPAGPGCPLPLDPGATRRGDSMQFVAERWSRSDRRRKAT